MDEITGYRARTRMNTASWQCMLCEASGDCLAQHA